MKLHFLGANRQVTGSRYLLEAAGQRILVDCGLFQERPFQDRNWAPPPVAPASIDAMLLTHAHLDHSGLIPKLVREGFSKPIYTTPPSVELVRLVLEDSARIQAEDVEEKQQRHEQEGRQAAHPYEPLYTVEDTEKALALLRPVPYDQPLQLGENISVTYHDAGHILGSALLEVAVRENGQARRLVFSGDLGMWDKPLIHDPTLLDQADYVVMESTYGDSDHDVSVPIADQLANVIQATAARGGNIVIPTFAIERAQELIYYLAQLLAADRMPHLMVFLDSPMAVDATDVFRHHPECLGEPLAKLLREQHSPFDFPGLVYSKTKDQSKGINYLRGSCIIMAGAGMCTGGRIKHHLARNLGRPESTILFVGYQGAGTLGREIAEGNKQVRVLGAPVTVRAKVETIRGLSAHADRSALLRWAGHFRKPRQAFLTHGEEAVSLSLANRMKQQLSWDVSVPQYQQVVELA